MKLKINGSGSYILKDKTIYETNQKEFKVNIEGDTVVISNQNSLDMFGNVNSTITINGMTITSDMLNTLSRMSTEEDKEPGVKEYSFHDMLSDINISGSSSLILSDSNILSYNLNCVISGSGSCEFNYIKSNILNCMLSGSSELELPNSTVNLCNLNCSGSSKVKLNSASIIDCMVANLRGSSSVKKEGAIIKNLTSNCSGVSSIK